MRLGLALLICMALAGCAGTGDAGDEGPKAWTAKECKALHAAGGTAFAGVVTDDGGSALPGAVVSATRDGDNRTADVDTNGCYVLAVEPDVTYFIEVTKAGYAAAIFPEARAADGQTATFTFALRRA